MVSYICTSKGIQFKYKSLDTDRPQHDRPVACVIAQQYSSAMRVSLRFHCRKEKSGAHFQIVTIPSLFFFKFSNLELSRYGRGGGGVLMCVVLMSIDLEVS